MEKVIFKLEKTASGIQIEVDGKEPDIINMIANAIIIEPSFLQLLNDGTLVAINELRRRDNEAKKPKSKIIT